MATTKDGTAIMLTDSTADDAVGERAAPYGGEAAERDAEQRRPADAGGDQGERERHLLEHGDAAPGDW